jgi:hypothetical protein
MPYKLFVFYFHASSVLQEWIKIVSEQIFFGYLLQVIARQQSCVKKVFDAHTSKAGKRLNKGGTTPSLARKLADLFASHLSGIFT